MPASPLLLQNVTLIAGAGQPHQSGVDIFIEAGLIAAIGHDLRDDPKVAAAAPRVIDCTKRLALPGFINAHTHSNESFAQGFWDALPLEVWLLHIYPPFTMKRMPERFHYLRTMLLAIESVRSGVTTVQDDLINKMGDVEAFDGPAAAYRDIGLRAAITTSMGDRQLLEPIPWQDEILSPAMKAELATLPFRKAADLIATFHRHSDKWNGAGDGRIRVILGPIGPQWCTDELLQEATQISLARGLPVHTHTLESKLQAVQAQYLYGCTMIEHLDRLGVLTPNFTLNHAIWLTDSDIELIGARGCSMSHNPLSNLKLGSGIARIRAMKNAGVNVALGTDGTSTSDRADMYRSLGMAALLQRAGDMDYETWITADEAFEMATMGSARSCGLGHEIGRIEIGRKADIQIVDKQDYGLIPFYNPISQLAYAVNSDAVRSVIVNGELIMDERRLTMIDEETIKAEMIEVADAYVRDHMPEKEKMAAKYLPFYRALHMRAAQTDIPASLAPVRLACGCMPAPLRHTFTCD